MIKQWYSKAAGPWTMQDMATSNGELIIFLHDYVMSLLGSVLIVVALVIVYVHWYYKIKKNSCKIEITTPYRNTKAETMWFRQISRSDEKKKIIKQIVSIINITVKKKLKMRKQFQQVKKVNWSKISDKKDKAEIFKKVKNLSLISSYLIAAKQPFYGFKEKLIVYYGKLLENHVILSYKIFFNMLVKNKDLLKWNFSKKDMVQNKDLLKWNFSKKDMVQISKAKIENIYRNNMLHLVNAQTNVIMKENQLLYEDLQLMALIYAPDDFKDDHQMLYFGFEILNTVKVVFYMKWMAELLKNRKVTTRNVNSWAFSKNKWNNEMSRDMRKLQSEYTKVMLQTIITSSKKNNVKSIMILNKLKSEMQAWFQQKKQVELANVSCEQASSLEMLLWWWTKFFQNQAYLDTMHRTQPLRFKRRDWIEWSAHQRLINLNRPYHLDKITSIIKLMDTNNTNNLYQQINQSTNQSCRTFWTRGTTAVDLWSSLFLLNASNLQTDNNVNNPILKAHLLVLNKFRHQKMLEFFWTLIPTIYLVLIGWPSLSILYSLDEPVNAALTVKALGHQWFWKYEYTINSIEDNPSLGDIFNLSYESHIVNEEDLRPGELRLLEVDYWMLLPINVEVRLMVSSVDVIHSFAVPSLGLKIDAVPGRLNEVLLYIKRKGAYYGQCSELCGVNHAFMPIVVQTLNFSTFQSLFCNFIRKS